MARTLVIYDIIRDNKKHMGKGWFGMDIYERYRTYLFQIQYPDSNIEEFEYGEIRESGHYSNGSAYFKRPETLQREQCLQRVINKLENDGYRVYPDQIALFMADKIDKLIMQKR
ncbi:MAG: hypothetical protein LBK66_12480 [Spirochaetaceae bacterium]|jgi:hypothetical protein|nr:hypothetical protein [Spirochaetaceae bacterium]